MTNQTKQGLGERHLIPMMAIAGVFAFHQIGQIVGTDFLIAAIGGLVICLIGLLIVLGKRLQNSEEEREVWLNQLNVPFSLLKEPRFLSQYESISTSLTHLAQNDCLLQREFALKRLQSVSDEVRDMANGTFVFKGTETWRTAYQIILEGLKVKSYYSVAWVKSDDYWRDPPGQQSVRLNSELTSRGYRIERVFVLPEQLWPADSPLPDDGIVAWIQEQARMGIHISLIRESDLKDEPDLLLDFGIYGDTAVGVQMLDERSRTERFILHFSADQLRHAFDRWERLKLYTSQYAGTLDQLPPDA